MVAPPVRYDDKINQFFEATGLPTIGQTDSHPDLYGRYVFDPSHIQEIVEVTTFGGTHYTGYTFTKASTGTLIKTTPEALILDSASASADQGPAIQRKEPIITVATGKKYGMLTRYKVTDTITKCQYLIGLAEVLTAFHGTGVIVDELIIGVGSVLYPSIDCLSEGTNDPILEMTHLEYRWERDFTI